jgi:DNA-binding transcriptional LysR family regulator
VLGAPSYFAAHGRPRTPEELTRHECIRYRFLTAGSIYRWEFVRGRREFSVEVGGVTVNDGALMMTLALKGMGLIYTADLFAAREVAAGQLESVLHEFLPTSPGLFLYFPARTQIQPKLRALIDLLTAERRRDVDRGSSRRSRR